MIEILKYLVVVLVLLTLQFGLLPPIFGPWPVPNLLLLLLLIVVLAPIKLETLLLLGFLGGLSLDLLSQPAFFGLNLIIFLGASMIAYFVTRHLIAPGLNYRSLGLIFFLSVLAFIITQVAENAWSTSGFIATFFLNALTLVLMSLLLYVRTR